MPVWRPPVSNNARRAAGDLGIRELPTIRRETTMISDLQSLVGPHGPRAELRVLVNVVNAGAIIQTNKNDVVLVKQKVTTATDSYDDQMLAVDTGTGNLAPVGSVTPVSQPPASETGATYDPTGDVSAEQTVEGTAPPETTAPVAETAVAGSVEIPPLDPATAANVEAQYGSDYTTPATPVDAPTQENLEAQYDPVPDTTAYEQQQANLAAQYDGI